MSLVSLFSLPAPNYRIVKSEKIQKLVIDKSTSVIR